MTSLARIARHLKVGQEQQPPAPAGGLGAALEQLIAEQVDARLAEQAEALQRYRERPVPVPATFTQAQPQAQAPAAQPRQMPPARLVRDELGRVVTMVIGDQRLNVIRDGEGRIKGMSPDAPPTPPTRQEQVVLDYQKSRDAPAPKPNLGLPTQRHDPVPDYEKSQR